MAMTLDRQMHQQLLDMLGAKDQEDAARIIAAFHGAHLSAQAKVRVTLPAEPVHVRHEWTTAKLGECVSCGGRHYGVKVDGELTCASCIDARRLDEWKLYASQLRKIAESFAARLSHGSQGDPLAGAAAEVLELERQCALDAEREKGISVARKGVQHLFVDDAYPPDTIPDDWSDKPFARIQWTQEDGDPSVGIRGWSGWTLAADQKGTMVGALAEFCRTDPENWERFNDIYNQTHEVP